MNIHKRETAVRVTAALNNGILIGAQKLFGVVCVLLILELWRLRSFFFGMTGAPIFFEGLALGTLVPHTSIAFWMRYKAPIKHVLQCGLLFAIIPVSFGVATTMLSDEFAGTRLPTAGFFYGVSLAGFAAPLVGYLLGAFQNLLDLE